MNDIRALAECILSGQVPDACVPLLVAETPGLAAELERRSRAMSPVLTVEAGRGDSVLPTQTSARPADPFADILFDDGSVACASVAVTQIHAGNDIVTVTSSAAIDWSGVTSLTCFGVTYTQGPDGLFRKSDPPNLPRDSALAHRLREQEGRRPVKNSGLLSQLIRSMHPASFLNRIWRK